MTSLLISKLVTQLLLPPGSLVLLAIVGLLFMRRWWGKGLLLLSVAGLWLLSTGPVRDDLARPLEFASPALSESAVQQLAQLPQGSTAIVVLGGGIRENAPEYGGRDELEHYALQRVLYAADLSLKTGLPVFASGGLPLSRAKETEGGIMRRQLIRFGVPEDRAFAEEASNNTWQNALFLKQMLQARGIGHVVLVTTAWHMPRSLWCFRQQGLTVTPAPTDFMTYLGSRDARSFLPDAGKLNDSSLALHEYIGLAWYRLRYGTHFELPAWWPWR